jgi:hypothetical protein
MSRSKAVVPILAGIGVGVLALFSYETLYILWAVSICLILYGVYLYAKEPRQNPN